MDRITNEAALWLVRAQDSDFSTNDREEFASWLAGSVEHVQEYLSVAAVTHEIREVAATYDVDELVALARAVSDDANVVALPGPDVSAPGSADDGTYISEQAVATVEVGALSKRDEGQRRRPVIWATAASLVLAIFLLAFVRFIAPDPDLYTTSVGEQVSFPLDDGSVITLNARSTLRVDYSAEYRDIHLTVGEAMFDVKKDSDRPFRVITATAVVQAVGTQFNVRHRGIDTTVTVVEGIVDVQSSPGPSSLPGAVGQLPEDDLGVPAGSPPVVLERTRIKVGQQAKIQSGEVTVVAANIDKATSWRERRLVFESWTLSAVVAEFNLYNDLRIVINDERLASRAISGVFSADDRESFALFLNETGLAVSETRSDGAIVLRSTNESP